MVPRSAGNLQGDAPAFELKSLNGHPARLSDYRGKIVLLNFWATWCGPCRVETPWLVELYTQYRSRGMEIVGVSMDDEGSGDAIVSFMKERRVNYTILEGNDAVAAAYGGARFLPQTFLIGRTGKILSRMSGLHSRTELENLIRRAL